MTKTRRGLHAMMIALLCMSCHAQKDESATQQNGIAPSRITRKFSVDQNLLGIWKIEGEDNPVFVVRPDSIFYIDHQKAFLLTTKHDSIEIDYDGWIYKGTYQVAGPVLEMKELRGERRVDRFVKVGNE